MSPDEWGKITTGLDREIHRALEAVATEGILKIRSRRATTRVFLLLSVPEEHSDGILFRILRHRSPELTDAFQGKFVKREWVIGFCQAHAEEALQIAEIKFGSIPNDCAILKESDVKVVVRDKFGSVVTAWKDGTPQLSPYDGMLTRKWERHEVGVTNWHYDSVRY